MRPLSQRQAGLRIPLRPVPGWCSRRREVERSGRAALHQSKGQHGRDSSRKPDDRDCTAALSVGEPLCPLTQRSSRDLAAVE
jgi:hypothetical protein